MATAVYLSVVGGVFDGVFLYCLFSPLDVLDEIWDLIESFSEGFLTYSCQYESNFVCKMRQVVKLFEHYPTSYLHIYRTSKRSLQSFRIMVNGKF